MRLLEIPFNHKPLHDGIPLIMVSLLFLLTDILPSDTLFIIDGLEWHLDCLLEYFSFTRLYAACQRNEKLSLMCFHSSNHRLGWIHLDKSPEYLSKI